MCLLWPVHGKHVKSLTNNISRRPCIYRSPCICRSPSILRHPSVEFESHAKTVGSDPSQRVPWAPEEDLGGPKTPPSRPQEPPQGGLKAPPQAPRPLPKAFRAQTPSQEALGANLGPTWGARRRWSAVYSGILSVFKTRRARRGRRVRRPRAEKWCQKCRLGPPFYARRGPG